MIVRQPLKVAELTDKFDVHATVQRRWHHRPGRRDPPRHHSRADGLRRDAAPAAAPAGFVTRDARAVERKKVGCARRAVRLSSRSASAAVGLGLTPTVGGSSSGRTSDSDSENPGSNPGPPAISSFAAVLTPPGAPLRAARRPVGARTARPSRPGIWLKRVPSRPDSRSQVVDVENLVAVVGHEALAPDRLTAGLDELPRDIGAAPSALTSTGSGKRPSMPTSLESSTMQTKRLRPRREPFRASTLRHPL
jgi:hypothetical protein